MKKGIAILISMILVISTLVSVFAADGDAAPVIAVSCTATENVQRNGEVTVSVAMSKANVKNLAFTPVYDESIFELVSSGFTPEIVDVASVNAGDAVMFKAFADFEGAVYTYTLKVKDSAPYTVNGAEGYALSVTGGKVLNEGKVRYEYTYTNAVVKVACPGHQWVENNKVDATCTSTGSVDKVCSVCGEKIENEIIPVNPNAHAWVAGTPVAATCTTDGYTPYTCANGCGATEKRDIVAAKGHNMVAGETVAPTCTEDGYTVYTCANGCGTTENRDIVPAKGHDVEWTVDQAPTCTEEGSKSGTCAACGNEATEAIPALGHDWVKGETVAPTKDAEGYTEYTCSRCDATKKDDVVPALGADKNDDTTKADEPAKTDDTTKAPDKADDTTKAPNKTDDTTKAPSGDNKVPAGGDNMIFAVVIFAVVACASGAIIVVRRKKEDQ